MLARIPGLLSAVLVSTLFVSSIFFAACQEQKARSSAIEASKISIYSGTERLALSAYPEQSRVTVGSQLSHGAVRAITVELSTQHFSGAVLTFPAVDLSAIRTGGRLIFWIKGGVGGEQLEINLGSEIGKERFAWSGAPLPGRFGLTAGWQEISIPLGEFSDSARWWDGYNLIPVTFDWSKVRQIAFAAKPQRRQRLEVHVGEIYITE